MNDTQPTPAAPSNWSGGWHRDFIAQEFPAPAWLIEPILPAGGVVFFHGPTSVGKSPFTWKIATAVSNGSDFFGFLPAQTGPVLYMEFDTPDNLLQPRLRMMEERGEKVYFDVWKKGLDITTPSPSDAFHMHEMQKRLNPVLVIINTLRKVHVLDDKDSDVPSRVYGGFRKFFPTATLLFVHHDKKDSPDPYSMGNSDQAFSGSQAWANDAQVALHIMRMAKGKKKKGEGDEGKPAEPVDDENADEEDIPHEKSRARVKMTKSQVSDHEAFEPLVIQLSPDGSNFVETGPSAYRKYFATLPKTLKRAKRISLVMEKFEMGHSSVHKALRGLK